METFAAGRTKAFISYSHQDKSYLARLQVHLKPLERAGLVSFWDDTQIQPGANWRTEIKQGILSAKVAILLISPDFLASDFIANDELPDLLLAASQGGAVILPVILKPCSFKLTPLEQYQAVNNPARPLSTLAEHEQDHVWVQVAERARRALNATGTFGAPKTKEHWVEEGRSHASAQRYSEAIAAFETALALDGNFARAHFEKGSALSVVNRFQEALTALGQAIQLDPHHAAAHRRKGYVLNQLQRYGEALAALEYSILVEPDYARAFIGKGDALLGLRRPQEALTAYGEALRLDSKAVHAYVGQGKSLQELRKHTQALVAYDRALQLEPTNSEALFGKNLAQQHLSSSLPVVPSPPGYGPPPPPPAASLAQLTPQPVPLRQHLHQLLTDQRPVNKKALIALWLGVVPLAGLCIQSSIYAKVNQFNNPFEIGVELLSLGPALVAVIEGHIALNEIRRSGGQAGGKIQVIIALVLGYLGIFLMFTFLSAALSNR